MLGQFPGSRPIRAWEVSADSKDYLFAKEILLPLVALAVISNSEGTRCSCRPSQRELLRFIWI